MRRGCALGALLLLCFACAHSPTGGVVHVVGPGETVWRIAHTYQVSLDSVLRANAIEDVQSIPVGTRLWIPGVRSARRVNPAAVLQAKRPAPTAGEIHAVSELSLQWPVDGRFSSGFGRRTGRQHDGIDISAPRGTRVRAADSGRVIESRRLAGYGNLVIVKHVGNYSTVYAHNRRNLVKKGQFVEQGEVIAEVGASGNATGFHLHFEVRRDRRPQDPLRYLPPGQRAHPR